MDVVETIIYRLQATPDTKGIFVVAVYDFAQ